MLSMHLLCHMNEHPSSLVRQSSCEASDPGGQRSRPGRQAGQFFLSPPLLFTLLIKITSLPHQSRWLHGNVKAAGMASEQSPWTDGWTTLEPRLFIYGTVASICVSTDNTRGLIHVVVQYAERGGLWGCWQPPVHLGHQHVLKFNYPVLSVGED